MLVLDDDDLVLVDVGVLVVLLELEEVVDMRVVVGVLDDAVVLVVLVPARKGVSQWLRYNKDKPILTSYADA